MPLNFGFSGLQAVKMSTETTRHRHLFNLEKITGNRQSKKQKQTHRTAGLVEAI
jgi:hypothetical protein